MGAGARRRTTLQTIQQGMLLCRGKRLPGFDRGSLAHSRDEPRLQLSLQGCFIFLEIFNDDAQRGNRVCAAQQGWDCPHQKRGWTEWLHLKTQSCQKRQLIG
jgi:hypothetical protein